MSNQPPPSLTNIQKLQIEDYLRQADKFIRQGRYLAADEMLQRVFALELDNNTAHSYEDRIQFLIKQLSQRTGLDRDVHAEIRKYRDLQYQRKSSQITSLLTIANKMLDDQSLAKAADYANRVLALEADNVYAKTILRRIDELQREAIITKSIADREAKFTSLLKESWQNGKPTDVQQSELERLQHELSLSDDRARELERDARNTFYREALHSIWLTGGIAAFTMDAVEQLRTKFAISRMDHSFIEAALLRDVRKNKIKGSILVVEDSDDELLQLTQRLRAGCFAVIAAGTVDEALASLNTFSPDIIISEIEFKDGLAGFALYEFIRSTPQVRHVPFFFVTSNPDRTIFLAGKRLGVDEFFVKPLDHELLLATIDGALLRSNVPAKPDQKAR